jgi:hypothetical protein
MKNKNNISLVLSGLIIFSLFICNSISYADGEPLPQNISIANAYLNGVPVNFSCDAILDLGQNSLFEFDIVFSFYNNEPELISYIFNPVPPGDFAFTPPLPVTVTTSNSYTVHFRWITPPIFYFGYLSMSISDIHFITQCEIGFDGTFQPVDLKSFVSIINGNDVTLSWATASEMNNFGFDIERSNVKGQTSDEWTKISFVQGHGTTTSPNNYEFTDRNLPSGKYNYRLKQIDFNGNFEYHNLSDEVVIGVPEKFELSQNYPNPFNPVTNLEFGIWNLEFVSLKVYNSLGKEVAVLVNEIKPAGRYEVVFDGSNLGSGVYFYKIEAGSFTSVKRMILIK